MRFAAAVLTLSLVSAWAVWKSAPSADPPQRLLRVCADPNNLPFSNQRQEGFENLIAQLIARDLSAHLEYMWWAQRRGFVRNTLKAGLCDVVPGIVTGAEMALTTIPYYRSTYVFVSRRDRNVHVRSFDSPLLRQLTVGVQLIGDDYMNTPPAHALGRRKIVTNVRGYRVVGNYSEENPPARIIDAVASGEIDVAIAWGPLAGYFAKHSRVPLSIEPVSPQADTPALPFVYEVSMGVRREDKALREELDRSITRNHAAITAILVDFGVPLV